MEIRLKFLKAHLFPKNYWTSIIIDLINFQIKKSKISEFLCTPSDSSKMRSSLFSPNSPGFNLIIIQNDNYEAWESLKKIWVHADFETYKINLYCIYHVGFLYYIKDVTIKSLGANDFSKMF